MMKKLVERVLKCKKCILYPFQQSFLAGLGSKTKKKRLDYVNDKKLNMF